MWNIAIAAILILCYYSYPKLYGDEIVLLGLFSFIYLITSYIYKRRRKYDNLKRARLYTIRWETDVPAADFSFRFILTPKSSRILLNMKIHNPMKREHIF